MKMSFRSKILMTIFLACVVCTVAAIMVARTRIAANGESALADKSRAILSRLEVGRDYIAAMETLDGMVKEAQQKFPDGNMPEEAKLKILKSVPIFASLQLGSRNADKEHYQFRVATDHPRRKENQATSHESEMITKFNADPNLKEWVEHSEDGKNLVVTRPVRLSEKEGCLVCHGNPSKSPWKNGKDILGYEMENMKDNELRATFSVISSLEPVKEVTTASTRNIILSGIVVTIVAMLLGFFIVNKSLTHVGTVNHSLNTAGVELATASNQISNVSTNLSSNATEAAASLEETVSSIEELTGMVTKNAENAREAASLSQVCMDNARRGEQEMKELSSAIGEISESSKKIEEIINVIDDIAFQTNLLALNAAVEAARAGEQGKGFAVVAEAVRSLAQRSANAAKDITVLIRESVEKVGRGSKIAVNSSEVLNDIVTSVSKVSALNNEISAASAEQASGISQISKAMNQLDQTTQQNAAASEEAAASAEELSAQAQTVQRLVSELDGIMKGDA